MRNRTQLSFMMLDIDDFKTFNDTYGHAHGDEVLKTVADIIAQTVRRSSDFAARWGGEEFAVLLPDTDISGASDVAEQIRTNVENTIIPNADGTETKVTISIGIHSAFPLMDMTFDDFCSKADRALYAAKDTGKNIVKCFSSYSESSL